MHLILTGATGLVGSGVLDAMIKTKAITKISILSRRPVPMAEDAHDPRINVILHQDFNSYPDAVLDQLRDATGCVWALGISQSAVSKEEYIKITKDYALAAASAFQSLPTQHGDDTKKPPFNFIFVSGQGATFHPSPLFTPLFGRVKGETELALAAVRGSNPRFRALTARPGFVDWHGHAAIAKYLPARGVATEVLGGILSPLFKAGYKSGLSPTEPLGRVLTELAMGRFGDGELLGGVGKGVEEVKDGGGFLVLENVALRRLAGLDS